MCKIWYYLCVSGMNKNVQAEMERLGRNYAQLLGHQNQKQKIRHIVKIKEENDALKRVSLKCPQVSVHCSAFA